jgi:hypothetical protein
VRLKQSERCGNLAPDRLPFRPIWEKRTQVEIGNGQPSTEPEKEAIEPC